MIHLGVISKQHIFVLAEKMSEILNCTPYISVSNLLPGIQQHSRNWPLDCYMYQVCQAVNLTELAQISSYRL